MNRRLKIATAIVSIIGTWLALDDAARADHSLADAMKDSETIAQEVTKIQSSNKVVCDVENSNQSYYYPAEEGELGTAWKQIALCFRDENAMMKAREYFVSGGSLGFYGAPNIVGVLVVSYSWENYQADRIISISYQ